MHSRTIRLIENLMSLVEQIHSNQIQIIDSQNDIQANIIRIKSDFNAKLHTIIDEVGKQKSDNRENNNTGSPRNSKKTASSLNNKVVHKFLLPP